MLMNGRTSAWDQSGFHLLVGMFTSTSKMFCPGALVATRSARTIT